MGKKGSYAEMHDDLIRKGYSYKETIGGKDKVYINKSGRKATIKYLKAGRSPQRVNVRLSDNLTMTRRHGTADTYELILPRKKKTTKKRKRMRRK